MTPEQRVAALRLIAVAEKWADESGQDISEEVALLRELASEPQGEPATVKESLQVEPAQAFYKGADSEPLYAQYARGVKDGFELGQREARIAIADGAANDPPQQCKLLSGSDLLKLARRCLWLAYVWNDHNFKNPPQKYAQDEAKAIGINSFEDANDWLGEAP